MVSRFSKRSPKAGRSHRKGGLLRVLGWLAFLPLASRGPTYVRLIWALRHGQPRAGKPKVVLVGAAGYVLLGRDLIPDDIPVLGGLDDLAVVILAVEVFFDGIPEEILEEKLEELAIDRDAFRRTWTRCDGSHRAREKESSVAARRARRGRPAHRQSRDRTESSIVYFLRRIRSREGHPDRRRRQSSGKERRDEGCRRRLCPELPDSEEGRRARRRGAYRAWQHDIASREEKRQREREVASDRGTPVIGRSTTIDE